MSDILPDVRKSWKTNREQIQDRAGPSGAESSQIPSRLTDLVPPNIVHPIDWKNNLVQRAQPGVHRAWARARAPIKFDGFWALRAWARSPIKFDGHWGLPGQLGRAGPGRAGPSRSWPRRPAWPQDHLPDEFLFLHSNSSETAFVLRGAPTFWSLDHHKFVRSKPDTN